MLGTTTTVMVMIMADVVVDVAVMVNFMISVGVAAVVSCCRVVVVGVNVERDV